MTRWWKLSLVALPVLLAVALASGLLTIRVGTPQSDAQAQEQTADAVRPQLSPPTMVAVAIGQLEEYDGESPTVDLRATVRDGKPGGALRFYSEEYGYYNGGVQTLTTDNGVVRVSGAGGLFPPDGPRVGVRYEAEFALDGSHASITVTGRDLSYTMDGHLDGLVHVWERSPAG